MLEFTLKQHINPITIWTLSARKWFSLCTRMSNCGTVNVHSSSKVHNKSTTPLKRCQTAHTLLILDIRGTLLRTFFIIGQLAKIYIDKSDKTMSYLIHIYIYEDRYRIVLLSVTIDKNKILHDWPYIVKVWTCQNGHIFGTPWLKKIKLYQGRQKK